MQLLQLSARWPLSSVGVAGVEKVEIDAWGKHSCLWSLYIDRVIACGDVSRLRDRTVSEAVLQTL